LSLSETKEIESAEAVQGSSWIGWFPLPVLPLSAVAFRNVLPPWAFMWVLALAIYFSLKWTCLLYRDLLDGANPCGRSLFFPRGLAKGEGVHRGTCPPDVSLLRACRKLSWAIHLASVDERRRRIDMLIGGAALVWLIVKLH